MECCRTGYSMGLEWNVEWHGMECSTEWSMEYKTACEWTKEWGVAKLSIDKESFHINIVILSELIEMRTIIICNYLCCNHFIVHWKFSCKDLLTFLWRASRRERNTKVTMEMRCQNRSWTVRELLNAKCRAIKWCLNLQSRARQHYQYSLPNECDQ